MKKFLSLLVANCVLFSGVTKAKDTAAKLDSYVSEVNNIQPKEDAYEEDSIGPKNKYSKMPTSEKIYCTVLSGGMLYLTYLAFNIYERFSHRTTDKYDLAKALAEKAKAEAAEADKREKEIVNNSSKEFYELLFKYFGIVEEFESIYARICERSFASGAYNRRAAELVYDIKRLLGGVYKRELHIEKLIEPDSNEGIICTYQECRPEDLKIKIRIRWDKQRNELYVSRVVGGRFGGRFDCEVRFDLDVPSDEKI